jgi:ABC-type polysaccharide/polyol phosphate transport system ATPase subunit
MLAAAPDTGTSTVAISATGLRKRYKLGEQRGIVRVMRRLLNNQGAYFNRVNDTPFEALGGVDFTCYRGEAVGIIGRNGSGKSTLLQILSGTTLPTAGEMRVRGQVVPLLAVGLGFHPELTGRENVTLFATSLGIHRSLSERAMQDVMAFAELEQHMDTPVKRYSSGMLSRLSFAIAMQLPGDIYVFDEVLAVVDSEFRTRCLNAIRDLHEAGRTVLFVSHDMDVVAEVCHRVIWLDMGRVQQFGPTAQVLEAYRRAYGDGHATEPA